MDAPFVAKDEIRAAFARAMSDMYRAEVPAYGALVDLVRQVNEAFLSANPEAAGQFARVGALERLSDERHGAIRLGKPQELAFLRRLFAIMGMHSVGYYDLAPAGLPVHATAFRPVDDEALERNPFRIFTSLLRLDLIADAALRCEAASALERREIATPAATSLIARAERQGGLTRAEADTLVAAAVDIFRWHGQAAVAKSLYDRLHGAHRLIADVASFRGPHINHLTPRTLDIDAVQKLMPALGIAPKESIEGPPRRRHPILLRQTSFKALEEDILFRDENGLLRQGSHTARFGEIEQRGAALTPKGRALYDRLLAEARERSRGATAEEAADTLESVFEAFPDDLEAMRREGLTYFNYALSESGRCAATAGALFSNIDALLESGLVVAHPQIYEDFLPVSAAGIFRSNLGDQIREAATERSNQAELEEALGAPVMDPFRLYEASEQRSLDRCMRAFRTLLRAH